MASFTRNKIKVEDRNLGSEYGRWVVMYEFDCEPPPEGSERTYNFAKTAVPLVQQNFIQHSEMVALLEGANEPGAVLNATQMLEFITTTFNYGDLAIDESTVPVGFKTTEKCFWATVSYQVKYTIRQIKVTAMQEFTSGTNTFPIGDTVASFRILVPSRYKFARAYAWNPVCCGGDTPKEKETIYHDPFPPEIEFRHYHLPPGLQYKPFRFDLRGEYHYKPDEEPPPSPPHDEH